MNTYAAFAIVAALLLPQPAVAESLRPDQTEFRALYKELVETNTTLSEGNCTLAAERMAARLKSAGMTDQQLTVFFTSDKPKEGGLVAVWPGTSRKLKPILLLAHIDVVEARRSEWQRDPFTLIEEQGYFFARGTADDKAQAAIFTDLLARMAKAGKRNKRTLKLALTCGEETSGAFNGAEWLSKNRRSLIDAEYALNEGGPGRTDGRGGKLLLQTVQVGEKAYQDFTLSATNEGGHSSVPVRDNAIYAMADALTRIRDHRFALEFNETTKAYFARSGAIRQDALGRAISTGATDGLYLAAVGIPVYGIPGLWRDPDNNGVHGLNERIEVKAVYQGRDYMAELITELANR